MMTKKDYEVVATVVYNLPHFKDNGQSHGSQRRVIALRLARAFAAQKHAEKFDQDAFLLRAENDV
jgi:hypothetical protein